MGHTVAAVERAGRVASALALCINEYVLRLSLIFSEYFELIDLVAIELL